MCCLSHTEGPQGPSFDDTGTPEQEGMNATESFFDIRTRRLLPNGYYIVARKPFGKGIWLVLAHQFYQVQPYAVWSVDEESGQPLSSGYYTKDVLKAAAWFATHGTPEEGT